MLWLRDCEQEEIPAGTALPHDRGTGELCGGRRVDLSAQECRSANAPWLGPLHDTAHARRIYSPWGVSGNSCGRIIVTGLSKSQHEIRLPRGPASAQAGFLGFSPYVSPMEEWEMHVGLREFEGDPDLTQTGLEMEDGIARGFARTLKWGRMIRSETLIHADDWACATPDRLFPQYERGIQIKNHGAHMVKTYRGKPGSKGEWDNNLVPLHYLIQCLFEMKVVRGAIDYKPDRWCLGAYFGGANRRAYMIRWDPILAKTIWDKAHEFWTWHINPDGPQIPPHDAIWHVGPEKDRPRMPKFSLEEALAGPLPTFGETT